MEAITMDEYILTQPQRGNLAEEQNRVTLNLEAALAGLLVPGAILHLDKDCLQSIVVQNWEYLRYDEETKHITRESWVAFKKHVAKYACLIAVSARRLEVHDKNSLCFSFENNGLKHLSHILESHKNERASALDRNLLFLGGTAVVIAALGFLSVCLLK